ncbi:MAG: carbohydrate kinase family protein, partial [Candidatus Kerfeldbacteria bacterium]|nr:carbohydrate kinase family protein [Candidatus Kerfeldbacteria bacterium]
MRYDVVTIGSASRDVFIHSSAFLTVADRRFPTGAGQCVSLGSKIEVDDIWFETGGGATNAAVTFVRNGFRTAVISKVGYDIRATEILRTLAQEKIDTAPVVQRRGASTGYSVILTNRKGGRTILV